MKDHDSCPRMLRRFTATLTTRLFVFVTGVLLPAITMACSDTSPGTPAHGTTKPGKLQVFSATQQVQWGEGSYYYPHTSYRITSARGGKFRLVNNNEGSIDEQPETVELPSGKYILRVQSEEQGMVQVPVEVRPYRLTVVHP